jgi:hypothetical protein
VSGTAAGLAHGYKLIAESGTYSVTGTDATLTYESSNPVMTAEPGAYVVSGSEATLTYRPARRRRGVARGYIIKGKRYFLTNEQLAYMLARDLIDVSREDIKVKYKTGKPHVISQNTWAELQTTLASLEKLATTPEAETYDDDEDALLLLL